MEIVASPWKIRRIISVLFLQGDLWCTWKELHKICREILCHHFQDKVVLIILECSSQTLVAFSLQWEQRSAPLEPGSVGSAKSLTWPA